jgi:hypothetical protein
VGNGDDEGG